MINKENNDKNFLEIQDEMKSQVNHKNIDVKNEDGSITKHPVLIVTKTEMKYSQMMKMHFKKNEKKKDHELIRMQNKINEKNNILFL